MKVLLDTNIIIHREASRVVNKSIGQLFRLLDKGKYTKCIHPLTIKEIEKNINNKTVDTFYAKLESYEKLQTKIPLHEDIKALSKIHDKNENDKIDTDLLNEVYSGRIDYFITEDKKIHVKSRILSIEDRVFTIASFIEKVLTENPEFIEYKVLAVRRKRFGEIDLSDSFFDSFRKDYKEFDKWYIKKSDEFAYVTLEDGCVISFLYLKIEDNSEDYSNISPQFVPRRRLKIGTFKITSAGARLSERFMKVIFDNALLNKVKEIYVTIFDTDMEKLMLINILEDWGFKYYGKKNTQNGEESVYVRDFQPNFCVKDPKSTYPYFSRFGSIFLVAIWPKYHSDLLPDSLLRTERAEDYIDEKPHRNAIKKVFISRSIERKIKRGDIIIFYRTGGYYKSVITTIGIVESIVTEFKDLNDFIRKCRKRSVFSDNDLKTEWVRNPNYKPFIVNFLYCYTFPKRLNLQKLIEMGVISGIESAPRGFQSITKQQFNDIIRETGTDESIIVD